MSEPSEEGMNKEVGQYLATAEKWRELARRLDGAKEPWDGDAILEVWGEVDAYFREPNTN
jgi:hypothetical protein